MKKFILFIGVFQLVLLTTLNAQSWSLTGNSGTNTSTNFIGTKDAQALVFRTNDIERMRIAANGFVGIGITLPKALLNIPSKGNVTLSTTDNFLLGSVNSNNLAFDYNKIQARNNGAANTLQLNPSGGAVALGNLSGTTNPGLYISADGTIGAGGQYTEPNYALTVNPGFTGNGVYLYKPVGSSAEGHLLYGANNSSRGQGMAIENLSSENQSDAIFARTYGTGNAISGMSESSGSGVYGYSVTGAAMFAYSANNYGIYAATVNATYAAYFNRSIFVNGSVFTSSDQKLKQNIQDFTSALNIIGQLHPKKYNYRQDGIYKLMKLPQGTHYGLIAQEVEKVLPNLVKQTKFDARIEKNAAGTENSSSEDAVDFKAVNYTELIPILIKAVQEQQTTIEELKQQINKLQSYSASAGTQNNIGVNVENLGDASLAQNIPNPLTNNTSIRYTIPAGSKAQLIVTDNNGNAVKQISLSGNSKGVLNFDASQFSAGTYAYTLIVDGKKIETKKMVIVR